MSLADFAAHHAELLGQNLDHFAEQITRYREGVRNRQLVSAVVTWDGEILQQGDGRREAKLTGTISLPSDSTLSMSDRWLINGRAFVTTAVSEPQYGEQRIRIEFRKSDMRGGSLGVL